MGPSGLPCPVGSGEDVVVEEIRADEENDVEIEEEHDEIIEEIENQEDGGEVIMHTHDRPHDRPHDRARDSPHHPPRIHRCISYKCGVRIHHLTTNPGILDLMGLGHIS